eukprot:SAG25_NODE_11055_length_315_cov_0.481481_1_plen_47_part_10
MVAVQNPSDLNLLIETPNRQFKRKAKIVACPLPGHREDDGLYGASAG